MPFAKAIELNDDWSNAYRERGRVYADLGRWDLAGEFDQAIARLRESCETKTVWSANVVNWLGLAMAYHKLGQTKEAQQWWDKVVHWIDAAVAKSPEPSLASIPGLHPHDWLACLVMRREAEALLKLERK